MYVGQSCWKHTKLRSLLIKGQWFEMIPKPEHLASPFSTWNLWEGQLGCPVLKGQITLIINVSGRAPAIGCMVFLTIVCMINSPSSHFLWKTCEQQSSVCFLFNSPCCQTLYIKTDNCALCHGVAMEKQSSFSFQRKGNSSTPGTYSSLLNCQSVC